MTWMATLRPLRISSSTSRDSSAHQGVVGLDLRGGALALVEEGVGLVDHHHDQRPARGRSEVPGVGDAEHAVDGALAVQHQPVDLPQHLAHLAKVVLGR
jgi:hypothetical protein